MIEFRVLGSLEVVDQDRPLALGGPRQQALLAMLLVHRGEPVSSDRLIDGLWGEQPPASAIKIVQGYVSNLRKVLGDGVLVTRGRGYLLQAERGQLDADRFESLAAEGRRALHEGDAGTAARRLREALDLCRGPPLAGFAYERFAQSEIARLEGSRLAALEERIDAELALGKHTQLVGELEARVHEYPLRERFIAQLMLALYRSGRQADALAVYQRARTRLTEELGLEPGPALKTMQAEILEQAHSLERNAVAADTRARAAAVPLPWPMTLTVGRKHEIELIGGLVCRSDVRLVTLVGPGGVGKTRLAVAAARAVELQFADRACWVELAGVARARDVGFSVAQALGVTPVDGESVRHALCRVLSARQPLVVLDNFEHVLDAAVLVGELLAMCPRVTVLATSREALKLAAEHRFVVEPLSVPDMPEKATLAEVERASATVMFIAAASRHDGRFSVGADTAPALARLCSRLDGLPLALELAAARTRLFGIEELAARLDRELSVLGDGPRDAPARQRTLQSTIEWSYRLLDEPQQMAFAHFSTFASGCTLEAASEVTGATLHTIDALIDKSLVDRRTAADGSPRLMMLETVREYALGRLEEDPQRDEVRQRHLAYYLRVVGDAAGQLWRAQEEAALGLLDGEIDNARSALQWALTKAPALALRLAGLLGDYWQIRQDPDALGWVDASLAAGDDQAPPEDRAYAQLSRSFLLGQRGDPKTQAEAANVALELYHQLDDQVGIATALTSLASCAMTLGDVGKQRAFAEEACRHARASGNEETLGLALARLAVAVPSDERAFVLKQAGELLQRIGNHRQIAHAYGNAAYAAIVEGRSDEALQLLDVAVPAAETLGEVGTRGYLCGNLGLAHLFLGDLSQAREQFTQEVALCDQQAFHSGTDEGLAGLAAVAAAEGLSQRAAMLIGAARALGRWYPADQQILDLLERDYFAPARARLGSHAWRQAQEEGAAMPYERAIAYALHQSTPQDPQPAVSAARERP